MREKTLYVCESPWWKGEGTLVTWSMQPFFQGLALLHGFRILYRTYTSADELKRLVNSQIPVGPSTSKILYIGGHGEGGRIAAGFNEGNINLGTIAKAAHRDIEGVWLSACDVGGSASLRDFLLEGGAVWAGGYKTAIEWEAAMLVDLAIVNEVMSSPPATSKSEAVNLFAKALRSFDPEWEVFRHDDGRRILLREAIHLDARDQKSGPSADNVTPQLFDKLRWPQPR